jgi:two-component system, sporulation sensor kinase D
MLLFFFAIYFFFRTAKASEQNKLWAGMAKETAHQIGTPLSSLVGWAEILKSENVNPDYIHEIEKDIERLKIITDRFSKVGSVPTMEKTDVVKETKASFDYIQRRSSKLINFSLDIPETPLMVNLNPQLYSWTIENIVKNGIDAMKGKGDIEISITTNLKSAFIRISDTGKGIPKKDFNKIFSPGFTSKRRGWGLGLSLAKRIIEGYHKGRIRVLKSNPSEGTTMEIILYLQND